jgi:hypothetical protein
MSMPVTQASTSSPPCNSTPPMVERRKRKACGVCEPCQQKANCGECTYCKNRKNSHQICKKRKCEVLKKKPEATSQAQVSAARGWDLLCLAQHQSPPLRICGWHLVVDWCWGLNLGVSPS